MDQIKQFSNSDTKNFWARLADWLISPPASVQEVGARRQAQLLAAMTLTVGILNTLGAFYGDSVIPYILSAILFVAYGISRTKFYQVGSWMVVIAISFSGFFQASSPNSDPAASILSYIPLAFVLGVGLLSQLELTILVVINTIIGFFLPVIAPTISNPNVYGAAGLIMTLGALLLIVNAVQISVEKTRREDLIKANTELQALQGGLEQRVAERTKALETSAEVSRRLASILDPRKLASTVVNEIQSAYNYYYAQIYLFDEASENLVLIAGTGDPGAEMMKRGHSLPKGRGLVGRAAENKESILVSDTSQDLNWLPNELLPDTKAEAVVPIFFGDKVLGVLDVQDNVTNDIFPEDITLLESLAGQVAISLQNARLLSQAKSFQDQFSLAVEGSNDGIWDWDLRTNQVYFSPRWKAMVGYEEHELTNGFADFEALLHPEDHDRALAAVNDYLSGKIPAYDIEFRFHHKDGSYRWIRARGKALRDDKGAPYRMAGSHTDITESREEQQNIAKRGQQQEALNLITQKIQSATTIESALQVTARELGRALGMKPTLVTLEPSALGGNDKAVSE